MTEQQLRILMREASPDVWAHAIERLMSDRLSAGGYRRFPDDLRERILCAWKDMKDVAGELADRAERVVAP